MQQALKLCSLALNPQSPSPTSTMVKVDNGFLQAYGGKFCIRVPVDQDIGAAFNPRLLATFFRKERKTPAYTIKFPKLTVSEGKERLTINCLPPEDLVIIDNIETPVPCTINQANLKIAADLIDTANVNPFALYVTFRDGAMISTNNKVFFMGESGLPEDMSFNIHKDAALALGKFKSEIVAISKNNHTVKFIFADKSSLCAHVGAIDFPAIDFLFEGDWQEFVISTEVADLVCDYVKIAGDRFSFHTEGSIGELEGAVEGSAEVVCKKSYFDSLLSLNNQLSFIPGQRLRADGENSVMIASMLRE